MCAQPYVQQTRFALLYTYLSIPPHIAEAADEAGNALHQQVERHEVDQRNGARERVEQNQNTEDDADDVGDQRYPVFKPVAEGLDKVQVGKARDAVHDKPYREHDAQHPGADLYVEQQHDADDDVEDTGENHHRAAEAAALFQAVVQHEFRDTRENGQHGVGDDDRINRDAGVEQHVDAQDDHQRAEDDFHPSESGSVFHGDVLLSL